VADPEGRAAAFLVQFRGRRRGRAGLTTGSRRKTPEIDVDARTFTRNIRRLRFCT